jgi:hypothetical protein
MNGPVDEQDDSTATNSSWPEYVVEDMARRESRWRLRIRPADLALFEPNESQPLVILRERMQTDAMLSEALQVLALKTPKRVTLKLSPEAMAAVVDWLGEGRLAAFYLKQRYSWVLAIGVIWILASLPLPGDPESGVDSVPLDSFGMGMGVALTIAWGVAKWRPHPALFLVDSLWFLCLTAYLTLQVWHGRSGLWMILVVMLLWMASRGFKHFARFRHVTIETAHSPPSA